MEYEKNIEIDDNSRATLDITIKKNVLNDEYQKLLIKYSKEISLPGFRRGKVPPKVLEAKYADSIKADLASKIIEEVLKEVFETLPKEEKPIYSSRPEIKEEPKLDLNNDFSFSVFYDAYPKIKISKDEGFSFKIPSIIVGDEDIQKELERYQDINATIKEKEGDDVVNKDDIVNIDYVGFDGEVKEKESSDYVFVVGKSNDYYNIGDDVLGMKKGEVKEIIKTYNDDFENIELRGKTRKITITLKTAREKILPKIDDELAQDISEDYKTLDDLKNSIKERLEKTIESKIKAKKIQSLRNELVKANPVIVPESMISYDLYSYYEDFARQYGISVQNFMTTLADKATQLENDLKPNIIKNLQAFLIETELKKKYEISLSDEEFDAYIANYAKEVGASKEVVENAMKDPATKLTYKNNATTEKLYDLLFTKSNIEKGDEISLSKFEIDEQQVG